MAKEIAYPSVFIIGSGNLAHALAHAFAKKKYPVSGWWARNTDQIKLPENWNKEIIHHQPGQIPESTQIILLTVSDSAIEAVADLIPERDYLICHCSGSVPINALAAHQRRGVFYPLQTFSAYRKMVWQEVPVFMEASSPEDLAIITGMASALSQTLIPADSEKRLKIHLAAVIASNFTNHLLYESQQILEKEKIDFSWIRPLMEETIRKAFETGKPASVQTGPAKRKDQKVLDTHLQLLQSKPDMQEIYRLISSSIAGQNH